MDHEERGLLDAIAAHPDDDRDRRVYADWLEDHGDGARAEFVRIQVALARLPEDHPGRTALLTRERGLLLDHEEAWTLGLRHLVDRWEFRRGFVDEVIIRNPPRPLTAQRFDELFSYPFVRRIVAEWQGWRLFPGLTESEGARRLEELQVKSTDLDAQHFRALLDCPRFDRLQRLRLPDCGLRGRAVRRLAGSDLLSRLRLLDLSGNAFPDDDLVALGRSPRVGRLNHLYLSACQSGGDVALALASAPLLSGLISLDLSHNRLGNEVGALLDCPHLGGLTELNLSHSRGERPDVWFALYRPGHLGRLTSLNLASNRLLKRQLFDLLSSTKLGALRSLNVADATLLDDGVRWVSPVEVPSTPLDLDLSGFRGGSILAELLSQVPAMRRVRRLVLPPVLGNDDVLEALLSSANLSGLRHLDVSGSHLSREGLNRLLSSGLAKQLTGLCSNNCGLGSGEIIDLANQPHVANLSWLSLRSNHVGSSGARALAMSPYLRNLRHLDLSDNDVGDEGANHLASADHLASPVVLDVSGNDLSTAAMDALFAAARRVFSRGVTIPQDQP